ncbi:MAG: NOL1/NOP2/sun family putative RNA methylase [Candidatus Peribacteraceae bacterium]|nr:NOL1/NOP2/sun family putative RNA methylase [Candidatus Peribacteraceae bacterium]MDD5074435.1 NOL1/NOP2/sun family putative RNA methylase [Candidatus Peribacteraceae bacterium]
MPYAAPVDHPFDRYAAFTDLAALKEASIRPLRKCVRVNTLKCSVETFKAWAKEKGWKLTPVPWSREGFFVEREDHATALGRDLRHLLGHFYMQEASSMLPVSLLDPQPGEAVLDLCAAPGSKTTQMADAMQGRGVIIANDMQEKRLRILCDALQRTGAASVVVTRKVGQWFGNHMTERFDRVLCDAPCTAQGTSRKDPTALTYCSTASIISAARLQHELLEAAVHAAKVGGRIVYSTCTLTPEENEAVALDILNKYCDQLEVVQPPEFAMENGKWTMENAVEDSLKVQKYLQKEHNDQSSIIHYPFLRLWPQTYNTEGFFCAVFRKVKRTKEPQHTDLAKRTSAPLPKAKRVTLQKLMKEQFGTDFLQEGDALVERMQQVLLTTEMADGFPLPVTDYACGIPFSKMLPDGRFRVTNELVSLRGEMAKKQTMDLSDDQLSLLLSGRDLTCSGSLKGDTILTFRGISLGLGLAKEGVLLNRLPRWVVKLGS